MVHQYKLLICQTAIHQPPVILHGQFPRREIRFQGDNFVNPLHKHPERDPSDHFDPEVIPQAFKIFEFALPLNEALVLLFPESDFDLF